MQSIEIEVKFRVRDPNALEATLPQLGFHCETPRTFERNILFDTPAHGCGTPLRSCACAAMATAGS